MYEALGVCVLALSFVLSSCDPNCLNGGSSIRDLGFGYLHNPPPTSRQSCLWTLRVPRNKVIELNITYLDLEPEQMCQFQKLEIYSDPTLSTRYCGMDSPPALQFEGPITVSVDYYSDKKIKPGSFSVRYKTIDHIARCADEDVTCRNGKCVSSKLKCNYKDECGDGTDEESCGHVTKQPASCGQPDIVPDFNNRIAGGEEAVPGSWPWQVSIRKKGYFPSGHFCGGSLINNLWILTAAHCVYNKDKKTFSVKLGEHDAFKRDEGETVRFVQEVYVHPEYNYDADKNDIGLLKMNAPVTMSETISPVCLPAHREEVTAGAMFQVTGWGDTLDDTASSNVLRQVTLPLVEEGLCQKLWTGLVSPNTLCTGYKDGGFAPCQGDSGGPMVGRQNGTNRWTIYGLVSWGHRMCTASLPSVYTKVSSFIPWIETTIAHH